MAFLITLVIIWSIILCPIVSWWVLDIFYKEKLTKNCDLNKKNVFWCSYCTFIKTADDFLFIMENILLIYYSKERSADDKNISTEQLRLMYWTVYINHDLFIPRYIAEILPIRHKTLLNQSVNNAYPLYIIGIFLSGMLNDIQWNKSTSMRYNKLWWFQQHTKPVFLTWKCGFKTIFHFVVW